MSTSPRFMWLKIVSRVNDKRETRRGFTRATRKQKWFVGNATNQTTRRDIVPFESVSIARTTKRLR